MALTRPVAVDTTTGKKAMNTPIVMQERLPTRLILSGLLAGETDRVAGAYAARGMTLVETRVHGDWAALVLTR